jgi:hypothetical protein
MHWEINWYFCSRYNGQTILTAPKVVLVEMFITRVDSNGEEYQLISSTNKYFMWTGIGLFGVMVHVLLMRRVYSPT